MPVRPCSGGSDCGGRNGTNLLTNRRLWLPPGWVWYKKAAGNNTHTMHMHFPQPWSKLPRTARIGTRPSVGPGPSRSLTRLKAFLFGLFLGLSYRGSILLRLLSHSVSRTLGHGHVGSARYAPRKNSTETAVGRKRCPSSGQNPEVGDKSCGGKDRY